ncbi:hypothetical protein QYF61_019326 [Mycteria americana]|uniref:Uncharacterized protein n=1 Tax=Mycteria americana TaxID=33587 RepID=A0AAN7MZ57_MYCAM|nr:hypothetical protein QYF61_019326 [Mycteria americana]
MLISSLWCPVIGHEGMASSCIGEVQLDIRKMFFTGRVIKHWKWSWPQACRCSRRLYPVEKTRVGTVLEELQPMERTHDGVVHEGLYPVGGTPHWSRGKGRTTSGFAAHRTKASSPCLMLACPQPPPSLLGAPGARNLPKPAQWIKNRRKKGRNRRGRKRKRKNRRKSKERRWKRRRVRNSKKKRKEELEKEEGKEIEQKNEEEEEEDKQDKKQKYNREKGVE